LGLHADVNQRNRNDTGGEAVEYPDIPEAEAMITPIPNEQAWFAHRLKSQKAAHARNVKASAKLLRLLQKHHPDMTNVAIKIVPHGMGLAWVWLGLGFLN
jgi:hypothetical protein